MKIFTSIAPRKIAIQQHAVDSWLEAGFQPVSLNSATEISLLRAPFPKVEFIETSRDAASIMGKPLVFFDDLTAAIAASGPGVSGIVNSDIILRSVHPLPDLFKEKAAAGLVYGTRVDIDEPKSTFGEEYTAGFDYFFMNSATARCYPPTRLSMGAPMWDYWAVLVPLLKGVVCRRMNEMCAFHIRHEQQWDHQLNILMLKEILDHSGIEFEGIQGVDFSTENDASKRILSQFGHFILPYLESGSSPVF
jgi:hypothetical protein